jgi:hypothetical protein
LYSHATAAHTKWPVIHGSAPHKAVVGVEIALAKANAKPPGNHAGKAILELLSHAEQTLNSASESKKHLKHKA